MKNDLPPDVPDDASSTDALSDIIEIDQDLADRIFGTEGKPGLGWAEIIHEVIQYSRESGRDPAKEWARFGMDVNQLDEDGETELTRIIQARRGVERVRDVLEIGADPNRASSHSQTPLMLAIVGEQWDVVSALVQKGADPYQLGLPLPDDGKLKNMCPLHFAIIHDDDKLVDLLLTGGASANRLIWDFRNVQTTPLHFAAYRGSMQAVKALIRHGANVNAETPDGQTPFDCAIMQNHIELSKFLEKHGKGM